MHPKSLPVIAERGQRNVYDLSGQCNKENLTILVTASAGGAIASPLALFKFDRHWACIFSRIFTLSVGTEMCIIFTL